MWLPPDSVPDDAAGLGQFEANGTTSIPVGATTDGTTVVLKGTVSDPDGGQVRLQVEVEPVGTPFDGNGLITECAGVERFGRERIGRRSRSCPGLPLAGEGPRRRRCAQPELGELRCQR